MKKSVILFVAVILTTAMTVSCSKNSSPNSGVYTSLKVYTPKMVNVRNWSGEFISYCLACGPLGANVIDTTLLVDTFAIYVLNDSTVIVPDSSFILSFQFFDTLHYLLTQSVVNTIIFQNTTRPYPLDSSYIAYNYVNNSIIYEVKFHPSGQNDYKLHTP